MARINKELVAMNLLTCPTSKEAAEKSGISVPTLYRLKKDTAFQNVLQEVKDNIFGETMHKAQGYCLESLEVLRTVMNDNTIKFVVPDEADQEMKALLTTVYSALSEKGYNPINQIVGYLLSEDPTYITNYKSARSLICKVDRDELLQELVRHYLFD